MQQPKFKFGDKVKNRKFNFPKPFIIKRVEWGIVFCFMDTKREGFRYFPNPEVDEFWPEEDLELFHEPNKEKLFAFKSTRSNTVIWRDHQWGENQFYKRFPDGDKAIQ